MFRRSSLLILCALLLIPALSAGAAGDVSMTLRVSNPTYLANTKACPVQVPAGANGIAVLDAAKATGCISSYVLVTYSIGSFVQCIDGVCGDPAPTYLRYWAMRTDTLDLPGGRRLCEPTSYGVDSYSASAGAELSFTFESYASGVAPVPC